MPTVLFVKQLPWLSGLPGTPLEFVEHQTFAVVAGESADSPSTKIGTELPV